MAQDTFYDENDPYRRRVMDEFNPNGGIVGPQDFAQGPTPAPAGGYDLEKFRKAWYGQGDVNNIQGWLDQHKDFTSGVTLKGEKAYDPSGRFIADLVGNYSGADPSQRTAIFLDGIDSNTGKARTAAPKGVVKSDVPGLQVPRANAGAPAAAQPAANTFLTDIRKLIMDRLGAMSGPPSMDDPALAAQSAAYKRARERGAEQERYQAAERAASQGLLAGGQSSGGFETTIGGIREGAGEDIAANDAALMGAEVQQRRAEIQNLMQMALASGDAESARQLQAALANLDAQLRREAMKMQDKQFGLDLNYRNRALGEQGRQFDDTLGRQYGRDYEDDYRWRVMYGL